MMPENVATRMPFQKLNSLMASFFFSSASPVPWTCRPDPVTTMPSRQTMIPNRIQWPDGVENFWTSVPWNSGGISVPKAEQ